MTTAASRVLVVAPNWIGDAVMALPAVADIRRHFAGGQVIVAARRGVAELFGLVPGIDEVITLAWTGRLLARDGFRRDVAQVAAARADVAVLLPNSFASAWLVRSSAVPERWGYGRDLRARLLTRAIPRPRGSRHQGEYYQHLVKALGLTPGRLAPELQVAPDALDAARTLLRDNGWDGTSRLVTLAPGAAYGKAKQWLPSHASRLVRLLTEQGDTVVLVGSRADASTTRQIASGGGAAAGRVVDLAGRTTLTELAAVLRLSAGVVSHDSGAMHVAAAVATPVVAIFGPTIEHETRPLTAPGGWAHVLTAPTWCRPCMLRECPLDHRCMSGIVPEMVTAALAEIPSHQVDRP